jgi:hypothetical protein
MGEIHTLKKKKNRPSLSQQSQKYFGNLVSQQGVEVEV